MTCLGASSASSGVVAISSSVILSSAESVSATHATITSGTSGSFTMEPLTTTSSNVLTQGTSARASGTPASGIATSVVTSVGTTITTGSPSSSSAGGLSGGAIGGIVGGILGVLLLISVGVTCYLLGTRRNRTAPSAVSARGDEVEEPRKQEGNLAGNLGTDRIADTEVVGGRLRYPDDQTVDGGRLGSSV